MKIQATSDLHFEFGSQHLLHQLSKCDSDVLVIAGDLHTSKGVVNTLKQVYKHVQKHVVFVTGNHDYYYSTKQYVDEILQENFNDHPYIHVLNNTVWEYKDTVFLGSTGWWTMKEALNVVHLMSDYELVYDLKPANCGLEWGWQAHDFFVENLKQYDKRNIFGKNKMGRNVVCITHNAPSIQSIDEDYKNDILNPCFANAWQEFMLSYKPDVWIHGHMHHPKEYKFDDTLVVCNPFGYEARVTNPMFDPQKIICLPNRDI